MYEKRMTSCRRIAFALLLAWPVFAQKTVAEQHDWIEGRSAHFQIYSNSREASAKEVVQDLETLRATLGQLIPAVRQGQLKLESPVPTSVYIFKDDYSFDTFRKDPQIMGFFTQHPEGSYLAILNGREESRQVTYHEYVHYFLRRNLPNIPLWLNEGMAEYFASIEVKKNEVRVGGALTGRMIDLLVLNLVPFQELQNVHDFSNTPGSGPEAFRRYGSAWITVHYLMMGNPQRTRQLSIYLELIRRGAPDDQAFALAFQCDPAVLGREVQAYFDNIRSRKAIPINKYDLKNLRVENAFQSHPMPKDLTLARLGLLDLRSYDKGQQAPRLFDEALKLNEKCAPAYLGKALIHLQSDRFAEAKGPILKAVELAPDESIYQILAGRILLTGPREDAQRKQAQACLLKGLRQAPGHIEALEDLISLGDLEGTSLDEITTLISAAFAQFPAHRDIPSRWAEVLENHGKLADALRLLEAMQAQGADPVTAQRLERIKTQLSKATTGK